MNELSLAIEIRDDELTVCCLRQNIKTFKLNSSTIIPISNAEINDEAITSLTAFIRQHKITTKTVSIALPLDWMMIKFLDIPLSNPDALDEIMTYEVQRHIPFDITNVLYSYRLVGKINELYRVILLYVTKDRVQLLEQAINKSGLIIENIGIASFYVLNLISYNRNKTKIFMNTVGRIKSLKPKEKLEAEGVIVFSRDIFSFWITINGLPIVQQKFDDFIDNSNNIAAIWTEINLFIEQYLIGFGAITPIIINQIILFGDNLKELSEHISSTSNYKVNHVKKIIGLLFPIDSENSYQRKSIGQEKHLLELAPSIGASLSGFGVDVISIKIHSKKQNIKEFASQITAVALIIIIFISFCVIGESKYSHKRAILSLIEQNIMENNPKISNYLVLSSQLDEINHKSKILQDDKKNSVSAIGVLIELSKIIPDDTYLTDIVVSNKAEDNSNNQQLIISGYSRASSNLIEILEHSNQFKGAEFIAPIIADVKGERFMIKSLIMNDKAL
jgi:hypothetical protein